MLACCALKVPYVLQLNGSDTEPEEKWVNILAVIETLVFHYPGLEWASGL